jgi:hypothetical protein
VFKFVFKFAKTLHQELESGFWFLYFVSHTPPSPFLSRHSASTWQTCPLYDPALHVRSWHVHKRPSRRQRSRAQKEYHSITLFTHFLCLQCSFNTAVTQRATCHDDTAIADSVIADTDTALWDQKGFRQGDGAREPPPPPLQVIDDTPVAKLRR